jgi:hypothetical protein
VKGKTKRLRQEAKLALADLAPLRAELSKLTEFVIQIYKTLTHALEGRYPHWKKSDRPVFPLVVTLEEGIAYFPCQKCRPERCEAALVTGNRAQGYASPPGREGLFDTHLIMRLKIPV